MSTPGWLRMNELIAYITAFNEASASPWLAVGYAADLAQLEANDRIVAPAIYVVPGDEVSTDSSDMKVIRQQTTVGFNVVTVMRHYRISDRGLAAVDEFMPERLKLRNHIIGFRPTDFDTHLRHRNGKLLRYTDELMVYIDEFSADSYFQKFL